VTLDCIPMPRDEIERPPSLEPLLLPLDASQVTLETGGGKGLNLSRLLRAGFPVPPGFIVGTAAYDAFVRANHLAETIQKAIEATPLDDPGALETASRVIRTRFSSTPLPASLIDALDAAYADLGQPPVAVRSSATAEDLPGLSFAGQQDTFLNVIGSEALQRAVVDCWSSLWTARAIGYRARNGIDQEHVSLAVVVQEMVPSEASGVLFTANPLTGKRTETVIDATFGLGEALVSGQVEPDHYVVDAFGKRILSKVLGHKATVIRGQEGGGTVAMRQDTATQQGAAGRQALPDARILELAELGRRVAELFDAPQDIEWASADGRLYLLQSRPITTLYPVPQGMPPEPLQVLLSFGAVQGLLEPISPLGRDVFKGAFAGAARLFGYRFTLEEQTTLFEAGERLWANISGLLGNRIGRKVALAAMEYVEPGSRQALLGLLRDGELPPPGNPRLRTLLRLVRVLLPVAGRALHTLLAPDAQRERLISNLEAWLGHLRAEMAAAGSPSRRLAVIRRVPEDALYVLLPQFVPRFGIGMATYNLLTRLAASLPDGNLDTRAMMRGLPHNVTTEMDLALWRAAQAIRADPNSSAHCTQAGAAALADEYLGGRLPTVAQRSITDFMDRYGMRGLGEIDLSRPRWNEDPTPLMQAIQSYLQIADPALAPDAVFERGRQAAEAEIERLAEALHGKRSGWIVARLARWAARRMRALAGLRETPKFALVRFFALIREALLADAGTWAIEGVLERPDDVFFLHQAELEALAAGDRRDWRSQVRARRGANVREQQRKQIPRLLLSDGRALYEGITVANADEGQVLIGSPVSPGVAEGVVRVVLDPRSTPLAPGEILVCPGTDPSWTPLFLAAGGLVMEVGGMMTHGAVVAREYGIPAVVGVDDATRKLRTGQRVRVDGSSGRVVIQ
jgi:phosphohistidine swiveling domain-containing protein